MSLLWVGRVARISVRKLMLDPLRVIGFVGLPAGILAYAVTVWIDLDPLSLVLVGCTAALAWIALVGFTIPRVRRDLKTLFQFVRLALGKRK